MTRITLITASWNSARTIADTLLSVAAQTHPDIEHIVVDGGSTDETLVVVRQHGKHVARVISEPDHGIFDAYNKGLAMATGDVIGIINSDDFYASDTVLAEVAKVFEDPGIDAVHAELVYVKPEDTSKVIRYWRSRRCTPVDIELGFHPAHPTLFVRRTVYERAGGFNPDYKRVADTEFMMRIFHRFRVNAVYVPRIWVRMRTGGASGGSFRSIWRQNMEVRRAQQALGIESSAVAFFLCKIVDRLLQRIRARFVTLPAVVRQARGLDEPAIQG